MSTRYVKLQLGLLAVCLASGCAGSGSSSSSSQPSVTVNPTTSNIRPGDPALQFSAAVAGTSSTAVTWSVNGTVGGNATVGVITSAGLYTPPASVPASPASNVVSVQASLVSAPTVQGASVITVLKPIPVVTSVSPQVVGVGAFTMQVNGSKFVNGAQVIFGGATLTTTFLSPTQLYATGTATASQAGTVTVTVVNPRVK